MGHSDATQRVAARALHEADDFLHCAARPQKIIQDDYSGALIDEGCLEFKTPFLGTECHAGRLTREGASGLDSYKPAV